jgi:predicted ATPase/DNA-binding CsgD family transcriptional regulator
VKSLALQPLSERQAEVASLIAAGKTNREIAAALFLSERTVESHIAAIFAKLGVRSRTEIVATVLWTGAEATRVQTPKTNLPFSLTELIGREDEVAEIAAALEASRLVTLTGTGGIGKTRTAVHVAAKLAGAYKDGVWLVELAPLSDATRVAAAIAHALGVSEGPGQSALAALTGHLRNKELLFVIDNCEHVVAEAARVADALLHACPLVRIIATSRESLKIAGERSYRLPPLPVPGTARGLTAAEAASYAAIGLFVERATASHRVFTLGDDNAAVIADICRRLDGLPLAIELAAARVRTLSIEVLAEKLDQRLLILTGGERTAVPRQQTLRALMDWSYDLLAPAERRLFERLSVFSGGGTLEAITATCADDCCDEIGTLDLLSSLVDKSLVVCALDAYTPRYSLLESARRYASEKLAAGADSDRLAKRHASAFLTFAERLEGEWDTASQRVWCAEAAPEAANLRTALRWTLELRGDIVLGQRLAAATRVFFANYGPAEGRGWIHRALAEVDATTDPNLVAKLELSDASFANMLGDSKGALVVALHCLELYRELGDSWGLAYTLGVAGRALASLGELERSRPLLDEALAIARTLGHRRLLGYVLSTLALSNSMLGDLESGRALYLEEIQLRDATGAESDAIYAASNLAELEFQSGDVAAALGHALVALARARKLEETALLVTLCANTCAYSVAAGDYDGARELAREALQLAREEELDMVVACTLQHVAAIAALREPAERESCRLAAVLLGFVDARLASIGAVRAPSEALERDAIIAALRRVSGTGALDTLFDTGALLSDNEAIDIARSI